MSFLKSLFGWGKPASDDGAASVAAAAAIDHKGFTITATPFRNEGQFQTSGIVTKTVDGVVREHKFIRADRHASMDDAVTFSLAKGRQIVDEQGERLFR
ncbi:MAG: transcription activator HlyU [Xanthobacteraceae bacterium]|nr:MAG: transcription activator HlyU [Xanthobacteraceae bacterium]